MKANVEMLRACGQYGAAVQEVELDGDRLTVRLGGSAREVALPDGVGPVRSVGVGPLLVGEDGRAHVWNGRGWSSPKAPRHVPVIEVRRKSNRLDGQIECTVMHPWHGGEYEHGTPILLGCEEFEARRRAGLVRGTPRSKRTMSAVVLRPWNRELREGQKLRLPEQEIVSRAARGEADFCDPLERAQAAEPATARTVFFESVALGRLDALPGEVRMIPFRQAQELEWRLVATVLEEGDTCEVDGKLVEVVLPGPPAPEPAKPWAAAVYVR
jgi:hypothetical protein